MPKKSTKKEQANLAMVAMVPLEMIIPSPQNGRKFKNKEANNQLKKSIETHGQLQPGVARPHPTRKGFYDLRAGCRRFNALKALKREGMLLNIIEMDDDEAMAVTLAENFDRNDLHILDQVRQIKTLLKVCKTHKQAAEKLNMTVGELERRLKLDSLSKEWEETFIDKENGLSILQIEHMIEVARLPEEFQLDLLDDFKSGYMDFNDWALPAFKKYIRNKMSPLKGANWDLNDETLTDAGPCNVCPARTGDTDVLFDDISDGDKCLNQECFDAKRAAFINRRLKQVQEELGVKVTLVKFAGTDGEVFPISSEVADVYYDYGRMKRCKENAKNATPVIEVCGPNEGELFYVKTDGEIRQDVVKKKAVKIADIKTPTAAAAALEDRKEQLEQKRQAHIIDSVCEMLDKIDRTYLAAFDDADTFAFAFGLPWGRNFVGSIPDPWLELEKASNDIKSNIVTIELMKGVIQIIRSRIKYQSLSDTGVRMEEVVKVCKHFKFDLGKLKKEATEAVPEPKSWSKLKELAETKPTTKKGKKNGSDSNTGANTGTTSKRAGRRNG